MYSLKRQLLWPQNIEFALEPNTKLTCFDNMSVKHWFYKNDVEQNKKNKRNHHTTHWNWESVNSKITIFQNDHVWTWM